MYKYEEKATSDMTEFVEELNVGKHLKTSRSCYDALHSELVEGTALVFSGGLVSARTQDCIINS